MSAPRLRDLEVSITVDMEQDCPPFLATYRGVEGGTPRLLRLLEEERIPATFFTTGDVARRYPGVVSEIVDAGHELGCHGDTHRRFGGMNLEEARSEIKIASKTLRQHGSVASFRAPNLDFPDAYVQILREEGYAVDSSRGRYKMGSYLVDPEVIGGVRRVPASIMPSLLRAPAPVRDIVCRLLKSPVVLFFHPWEFVDMTRERLRFDNRLRTGEPAVECLRQTICHFKGRGAKFLRISEVQV